MRNQHHLDRTAACSFFKFIRLEFGCLWEGCAAVLCFTACADRNFSTSSRPNCFGKPNIGLVAAQRLRDVPLGTCSSTTSTGSNFPCSYVVTSSHCCWRLAFERRQLSRQGITCSTRLCQSFSPCATTRTSPHRCTGNNVKGSSRAVQGQQRVHSQLLCQSHSRCLLSFRSFLQMSAESDLPAVVGQDSGSRESCPPCRL